jgi:hypothetical protein
MKNTANEFYSAKKLYIQAMDTNDPQEIDLAGDLLLEIINQIEKEDNYFEDYGGYLDIPIPIDSWLKIAKREQ